MNNYEKKNLKPQINLLEGFYGEMIRRIPWKDRPMHIRVIIGYIHT